MKYSRRFTLRLDRETDKKLKIIATLKNKSCTEVIIDSINDYYVKVQDNTDVRENTDV